MARTTSPVIDGWYHHAEKAQKFLVTAIDEHTDTVEIQCFDGTLDEFDLVTWYSMDVESVEAKAEVPKATEKQVLDAIIKLNNDKNVYGILIQLPVPSHMSADNLINSISPNKDVEGLNPCNLGKTLNGDENIVPCTPLSVLTILEYEKTKFEGKDVVIVNHSNHVGKPTAALMLNRNATASVVHVFTKDLAFYTKNADILITAAGVAGLIKKEHVKPGAFVVDVAIVSTKEGICGDVDEPVKDVAGKLTPVPGGVGPVTVACSLKNMIKTFKNCI